MEVKKTQGKAAEKDSAVASRCDMGTTGMVVFGFLCAIGLFDIWCVVSGGEKKSVSQFITNCSKRPLLAFIAGVLTCHWFGWMMFPE